MLSRRVIESCRHALLLTMPLSHYLIAKKAIGYQGTLFPMEYVWQDKSIYKVMITIREGRKKHCTQAPEKKLITFCEEHRLD